MLSTLCKDGLDLVGQLLDDRVDLESVVHLCLGLAGLNDCGPDAVCVCCCCGPLVSGLLVLFCAVLSLRCTCE